MSSSMRSLFTTLRLSLRTAAQPADAESPRASVPLRALAVSLALLAAALPLAAQLPNRITAAIDPAQTRTLLHHRPAWASAANDRGPVASSLKLDSLTLVLQRSPQQQAALTQLLADQQNPASPQYHQWLTPTEMGLRFGLSDDDIATLTGWLQSQGLHVNWVAPNRVFLGFGGAAADVNRAFQTELHTYSVNGESRYSINADPAIPAAIAPAILAIRGLSTPSERPDSHFSLQQSASPQLTVTNNSVTSHFITPADFATIYDVPTTWNGSGVTIGIVGWSRVNTADLSNFRSLTGTTFANPTEIVPTAYGGIDPGNPYTTEQSCSTCTGGQFEATLDVLRAGSTAPAATLKLVVSTSSGTGDGIGADAQYLVNTTPLVQVMSISFGNCEIDGGSSEVNYWDSLFKTAAGEGISVFVSSGDSGAAGCDTAFKAPPSSPNANSPNAICSSSYATCVGGTEFNDSSNPSTYWGSSSQNSSTLESVYGYIPEGGWNESTSSSVAASGGGVSTIITPTPSWQTGTGVPSARTGRYTPDVSFSAAGHDSYFGCMAAVGGSCVVQSNTFDFVGFYGTSAAAPAMAGVAALLDQKLGGPQGNLDPGLYALAATAPGAFHDVTVATSGVSGCSLSTASLCNNSIASLSGGAQQGYQLQTGFDEVTGLGSLNLTNFLIYYSSANLPLPIATTNFPATAITSSGATVSASVNPNGKDTHVWFLYGITSTLSGASQTASQDLGSGTTPTAVSANLSGLNPASNYNFQVVAQNSTGTAYGEIESFTTSATDPAVTTGTATSVVYNFATLEGSVNPNGASTNYWFQYGTSSTLSGASQTTAQVIDSGITPTPVSDDLGSLNASTKYYFRLVAQNSVGTTYGAINSFTTPAAPTAPTVTTGSASSITAVSAMPAGSVNPNGADTHAWCVYGTSSILSGANQSSWQDLGSGTTAQAVAFYLSGLNPSTTYYFQVGAQNSVGTTYGAINSFTTPAPPPVPTVTTGSATAIAYNSATLNGTANPNGGTTTAWFVYGLSSTLNGGAMIGSQSLGSGTTSTAISTTLTGLNPSTTYYYQAAAQNSSGTSLGAINSFTTAAAPTFTVSGTTPSAISSPGGTTTSTITLTSEFGFSGSIVLSGAIGQYPSGASLAYIPTFTFSPSSTVSLSSGGTQQVTVNILTTAASTTALRRPSLPWYGEGGAALACLLFFGLPARRRRWLSVLGLALLFVAITSGVSACSGGGSGSGGGGTTIAGTTPGTYTFLVTGSSGSTTVISSQITLTVN